LGKCGNIAPVNNRTLTEIVNGIIPFMEPKDIIQSEIILSKFILAKPVPAAAVIQVGLHYK